MQNVLSSLISPTRPSLITTVAVSYSKKLWWVWRQCRVTVCRLGLAAAQSQRNLNTNNLHQLTSRTKWNICFSQWRSCKQIPFVFLQFEIFSTRLRSRYRSISFFPPPFFWKYIWQKYFLVDICENIFFIDISDKNILFRIFLAKIFFGNR